MRSGSLLAAEGHGCSTSRPTAPARASLRVHSAAKEVTLLDYGAGNVRSVRNAIKRLGYTIKDVGST